MIEAPTTPTEAPTTPTEAPTTPTEAPTTPTEAPTTNTAQLIRADATAPAANPGGVLADLANGGNPTESTNGTPTLQEMTQEERADYYREIGRVLVRTLLIDSDDAAIEAIQEMTLTGGNAENVRETAMQILKARKEGRSFQVDVTRPVSERLRDYQDMNGGQETTKFFDMLVRNLFAQRLVSRALDAFDFIRENPNNSSSTDPAQQQELMRNVLDGMIQGLIQQRDAPNGKTGQEQNIEDKNIVISLLKWFLQLIKGGLVQTKEAAKASAQR